MANCAKCGVIMAGRIGSRTLFFQCDLDDADPIPTKEQIMGVKTFKERWEQFIASDDNKLFRAPYLKEFASLFYNARDEEVAALATQRDKAIDLVNFFAGVIKCGEPWTATCSREFDELRALLTDNRIKDERDKKC